MSSEGKTMDALGIRIVRDRIKASEKREGANDLERQAKQLRREADEIERLLELSRHGQMRER